MTIEAGNERVAGRGALDPEDPTPAATHSLTVESLVRRFSETVTALDSVSLAVDEGEFVTLLGPSGCGKSTLLRIVAGIDAPTGGTVRIGDRIVSDPARKILLPPEKRSLGMVFQSYAVWPHMTVFKNVAYPLKYAKVPKAERAAMVHEALESCELGGLDKRYPHELSGGQQQRVALARAIVARPKLLLLDEPLSNLDARLRDSMRVLLKELHLELGLTMLYVTHDQSEAYAMSDRILVMDHGVVLQEGTPEDVRREPANRKVAEFLGYKNFFPATLTGPGRAEFGGRTISDVRVCGEASTGSDGVLTVRPEDLRLATGPDDRVFVGEIELVQFLGNDYEHQIELPGDARLVASAPRPFGERGDTIALRPEPGASMFFPSDPSGAAV
jgi:iron(III) transport system ATP-binding protein